MRNEKITLKGHNISMAGKGKAMWQEALLLAEDHLFERLARERDIYTPILYIL